MPFQDRRGQGAYTSGAASRDLLPSIGLPALALRLRDQRILGQDERPVSVFPELGLGVRLALPVAAIDGRPIMRADVRSEEHTSELQSLMRISYAVFCLKKKTQKKTN